MVKQSAGILLYRRSGGKLEVLLAHPGGPFWAKKDDGAWGIPKGIIEEGEDILEAAKREFKEETNFSVEGEGTKLTPQVQKINGKIIHCFAFEGEADISNFKSNVVLIDWPPKSGKKMKIPEIDKAEWFDMDTARQKIRSGQDKFLDELEQILNPKS